MYPYRVAGSYDSYCDSSGSLHQLYGFQDGGLALIRPDGYIAFLSHSVSADGLLSYLRKIFTL
ncbi:hypothetical protein [Paenibacillus arenilitoris]